VENARLQAPRVADARGLEADTLLGLVDESTDEPVLDVLGQEAVNVVRLNVALADLSGDPEADE
jgi:potassium-transporting ATPase KdpC subunit